MVSSIYNTFFYCNPMKMKECELLNGKFLLVLMYNFVITSLLYSISITKPTFPPWVMAQARNLMKCCLVNKNERPNIFLLLKICYFQSKSYYINISEIISLPVYVSKMVRTPNVLTQIITFILDCKITILVTSSKPIFKVQRLTLHMK